MKSPALGVTSLLFAILVMGAARSQEPERVASSGPLGKEMAGKRILHLGAHPDDENVFAPMLAEACRFNGATCHLVVATEAESWGCFVTIRLRDPIKCSAMRRLETAAAAANLNATHEFYGWREGIYNWTDAGVSSNLDGLAREQGGHEALVARFRRTLDEFRPDIVLGFDPRHGTTCHPSHRAIWRLMLEAINGLPGNRTPQVWFESDFLVPGAPSEIASITDGYGFVRWPKDPVPVTWYDANVALPDGRTAYDYLVDGLRLHATQFPDVATGKLTPAPKPEHRRIPMLRLQDIDPHAQGMCDAYVPVPFKNLEGKSGADLMKMIEG